MILLANVVSNAKFALGICEFVQSPNHNPTGFEIRFPGAQLPPNPWAMVSALTKASTRSAPSGARFAPRLFSPHRLDPTI